MYFLIGLAAAALALVFAKGRRLSIAAACFMAGVAAYFAVTAEPMVKLAAAALFAVLAYAAVRIAARLTGAITRRTNGPLKRKSRPGEP